MSIIKKGLRHAISEEWMNWMPDRPYLKLLYRAYMGKRLDLKHPKTYNEKLQWLKLYDHDPRYPVIVDKYAAKQYVAERIGEQYIIPTLGVWDRPEDIDFDALPDKFVLKSTHDSGGFRLVDKRKGFDREEIVRYFKKRLSHGTYQKQREWPYKDVPRRVLAEQYMEDEKTGELRDYKFFGFDGKVTCMFIATDRQSKERPCAFDFFDTDFNWMDLRHGHPNAPVRPEKPKNFDLMLQLSEELSKGFLQLRVDLYEINGKVYFGELTLFHHGGITPFDPEEWDERFGEWIDLSKFQQEKGGTAQAERRKK